MPSDLSNTLIQLSFPAAIQIIGFFIPVLYIVVRNNQALEDSLFDDGVSIFGLIMAVILCEALYVSSVLLIVVDSNLPRAIAHMSGIAGLDLGVLALLVLFGLIPLIVCVDVVIRHFRSVRDELQEPDDQQYQKSIGLCLGANLRAMPAFAVTKAKDKLAILKTTCAGRHKIPSNIQDYCLDHDQAVRFLGLNALYKSRREKPSPPEDLALWLGNRLLRFRFSGFRRKYRQVWGISDRRTMKVALYGLAAFAILSAHQTLKDEAEKVS